MILYSKLLTDLLFNFQTIKLLTADKRKNHQYDSFLYLPKFLDYFYLSPRLRITKPADFSVPVVRLRGVFLLVYDRQN